MMEAYLEYRFNRWYANARIDYGVSGRLVSVSYNAELDVVSIQTVEDGEMYYCNIEYASAKTPEQIFDIWMEA